MQKVLLLFSLLTMLFTNIATGLSMSYGVNGHKATNTSLRANDFPPSSQYIIDFDAAPPTFTWVDSNKVQIIGDVLLSADTATDAGFDYIINMEIEGGPGGNTPINFPASALTSDSKFQQSNTKIGFSGGNTALVYAIDGRTVDDPITYLRDPSSKMTFSLELDSGEDFVNITYEVGDMDYNFESSVSTSACFELGESNDYRCRYSYIDRITFLSGVADNQYSFSNPAAIHQVNAAEFYSQFTDVNENGIPDISNDGRVPSADSDGNIQVYNPNNIGKEIKFTYDDYGSGIEGDADGFHDFDSRNQIMSFLTGMTFDVPESVIACIDTVHTELTVTDTSLIVGDLFCITLPEGTNYKLTPIIGLDCDTCQFVCFTADTTISYTVTWTGQENNCPHVATINLNVLNILGGCVNEDLTQDGIPNQPIDNITVQLFNQGDTINPIEVVLTDENGKFLFDSLPAGKYYIAYELLSGYIFPIGDINDRNGFSDLICVTSGEEILDNDVTVASCHEIELSLSTATIIAGDSVCVSIAQTRNYIWTPTHGISCDTCQTVCLQPDSTTSYTVTWANQDIYTCPHEATITVTVLSELGGCVNEDLTQDGIPNQPIGNITVQLFNQGDTINPIEVVLTDENGKFLFDSLSAGKYYIAYELLSGYIFPIGDINDRNGFSDLICVTSGEEILDNDVTVASCHEIELSLSTATIIAGDSVCVSIAQTGNYIWTPTHGISCDTCQTVCLQPDSTTSYTVTWANQDIYACPHEATITVTVLSELGGCVREDLNRDGVANDGNTAMENIVVNLFTQNDTINPIQTTVTNEDGKYLFDSLPAGKYYVSFIPEVDFNFAPGFTPIGDMINRNGYSDIICLESRESDLIYDALLEKCYTTELSITEAKVFAGQEVCVIVSGGSNYEWSPAIPDYENCDTCTVFKIAADSSRVYTVSSQDETACSQDEAQLTITTAFIDLSDPCNCLGNKQFGEVITIYSFSEGETWTYSDGTGLYDRNDPSILVPFGTVMTYGGVNADGFHIYNMEGVHIDSIGYTVNFTNGIQNLQISNTCYETDLCNGLPIGSLGGCVREDLNRDALANDGSTPMENILVNLYVQGDTLNPIATTTTDLDGKYLFDNLPDGKYFVEFTEPTDFIFPKTTISVGNLTDRNGFTDLICLGIGENKLEVDALLAKCYGIGLGHRNFEIYEGDSVTVSITEPGDYIWKSATGINCINCQTVTLAPDSTTTYTIQWNKQDKYNCTHESWITVKVLPIPCSMSDITVAIEAATYPTLLSVNASVGPTSTMSYQWQSSALNCEEGFSNIVGATASTYEITETTTDQFFRILVREHSNDKKVCVANSDCISLGRIAGCVNEDITDSGFSPLNNVTVNLYTLDNADIPLTSTTTNEDGKYDFNNLPTGKYFVEFIAPNDYLFPVADLPVGNLAERNGLTEVICLEPNEDQLTVDAYVGRCGSLEVNASTTSIGSGETATLTSSIGNVQWLVNGDVICNECPSLDVAPTETTIYQFQRIDPTYGCIASGSITIDVRQPYVEIENPCTCGGFVFKEAVTVYSYSADEDWTLSDNAGFYQLGAPLRQFPSGTPIPYVGVNEEGLHVYSLKGQHKDAEGYQLSVENGSQNIPTASARNDMSVSNLCFLEDLCPEILVIGDTSIDPDPEVTPDFDPEATPAFDPEATPVFPVAAVTDCTKPNVYAIHGLSIDLMRTGMIQVWANDFAHNSLDECLNNGSLVSRIWHPSVSDKSPLQLNAIYDLPENLIFTCEYIGVQEVYLYIVDENGDWNFAKTYIDVQDNLAACTAIEAGNTAMVSGVITDWKGNTIQSVDISSMDQEELLMGQMTTTTDGTYAFELPMDANYTIIPKKDTNPLNGVSTFDLVLMTKHILGIQPFNSPYQWIAADVNTSGTVTTFDIVQLRKMILGIDKQFVNNTSWRFLAADYIFESATILNNSLEESSAIIGLHQNKSMDFIAIKTGDINGSAQASTLQKSTSRNSKEVFTIEIEDQLLEAGKAYDIIFTSEQVENIQGYQFTLAYNDLSVTNVQTGIMGSEHFGLHRLEEGLLTASWNSATSVPTNTPLFTLQITANQTARLSEVLQLQNNPTITEAYDQHGNELSVAFSFTNNNTVESFELFQNEPNPFNGQTTIGFYLPGTSEVELILRDDTGRIIKRWKENRTAGLNYIQVDELENNKGLLYYQLITNYGIQSKKMLQLR